MDFIICLDDVETNQEMSID